MSHSRREMLRRKALGVFACSTLFLLAWIPSQARGTELSGILAEGPVAVKVIRDGAPLYRRADGSSDIVRTATIGEEFPVSDFVPGFYLVRDEVTESSLWLDPLDGVLTGEIVRISEPQAFIRAPDEEWYWLDSSFFIIEDEHSDRLYSGRYSANIDYVPRIDPVKFVEDAIKYLGVPYKWGGESSSGVDCSGLVLKSLNEQGFKITHKASIQAKYGRYVPYDNLRPGDVLFFTDKKGRKIGHCGIYLGKGKFIHAASSLGKVGISSIFEDYYRKHLILARRY